MRVANAYTLSLCSIYSLSFVIKMPREQALARRKIGVTQPTDKTEEKTN